MVIMMYSIVVLIVLIVVAVAAIKDAHLANSKSK
jgi:hypothetical protein